MRVAAVEAFPEIAVSILGAPSVRRQDGTWASLSPLVGDLLVALALAGEDGRSKSWLLATLWADGVGGDNAIVQAVRKLRAYVSVPKPPPNGNYVLDVPSGQVDALVFRDRVAGLGAKPAVGELDALLGLWRDVPWVRQSRLRTTAWAGIQAAMKQLVNRVLELPAPERDALTSWHTFCELFPTESGDWREEPSTIARSRKRILIVDDKIAAELATTFGGRYDCDTVTSLEQWSKMVREGHPLDYDCVLVDLHLKDTMSDSGGEIVLKDMRQLRPDVPTVLMSAELPFEDWHSIRERLSVSTIIAKHNDQNGPVVPLHRTVARLIEGAQG